jgi:EmrB/QacA subfamily drug resistance transporter
VVVLVLGSLMTAIDITVATVALHAIEGDLHSPVADAHWVLTAPLLAGAAAIPVSGWLARRFGPRRIYIMSLSLFAASSGMCAVASSLGVLVAFRALEGVADGLLLPLSQVIAAEVVGSERIGRIFSRIWMATSLGVVAGPSIGGAIVDSLGWRWIFVLNVPLGLFAIIAALRLLPATPARAPGPLDVPGLLRLSSGLPCIVYGLVAIGRAGTPPVAAVMALGLGLALLLDFVRHAFRVDSPLLDLRLWARRTFASGALSLFLCEAALFGPILLLPLYFQQVHHLSPGQTGLLMAPQGVGNIFGLYASGRVRDSYRAVQVAVGGAVVLAVATAMVGHLGPSTPDSVICLVLLVAGVASGLVWVPAVNTTYMGLDGDQISHASTLVSAALRVAGAFATALAAIVLQRELHDAASTGGDTGGAFVGSFHWIAVPSVLSAVVFVAMARTVRRARGLTPAGAWQGVDGSS